MAANWNDFNFVGGGGGGMQNNMMSGMPSFSQYNQWASQMGGPQQLQQQLYQVGQNGPIDSNAPFRKPGQDMTGPNEYMTNQVRNESPYQWSGGGWTSTGVGSRDFSKMPSPGQIPPGRGAADNARMPGPNRGGFWNANQRPQTEPYQMPMNRPQIGASNGIGMQVPGGIGPGPSTSGNPLGPRPQQPPLAPGQHPYNGPAIGQYANYQPGQGIGPGGPTRSVPNFRPGGPAPWNPQIQNQQQQVPYRTF